MIKIMKGDNNMEKNEILKYLYELKKTFTKLLEEEKNKLKYSKKQWQKFSLPNADSVYAKEKYINKRLGYRDFAFGLVEYAGQNYDFAEQKFEEVNDMFKKNKTNPYPKEFGKAIERYLGYLKYYTLYVDKYGSYEDSKNLPERGLYNVERLLAAIDNDEFHKIDSFLKGYNERIMEYWKYKYLKDSYVPKIACLFLAIGIYTGASKEEIKELANGLLNNEDTLKRYKDKIREDMPTGLAYAEFLDMQDPEKVKDYGRIIKVIDYRLDKEILKDNESELKREQTKKPDLEKTQEIRLDM